MKLPAISCLSADVAELEDEAVLVSELMPAVMMKLLQIRISMPAIPRSMRGAT